MKSNYSLVIQGPILSKGRTGRSHLSYDKNNKKAVVSFDCKESIQQMLKAFAALFNGVVVVTWEGEEISNEDFDFCTNCTLIQLKPIEKKYASDFHPTGEINFLKQFISTQAGIEALQEQNPNQYIVKIRTDQYLDLGHLLAEHQGMTEQERQQKIGIPFFVNHTISDFYFVGRQQLLINLCQAITTLLPKHREMDIVRFSVHLIAPLLYERYLNKENAKLGDVIYLKSLDQQLRRGSLTYPNAKILADYTQFIGENFVCFSRDLLTNTLWRGERYEICPTVPIHFEFLGDEQQIKGPKLDAYNIFLYCSPMRYFRQKCTIMALLGLMHWFIMTCLPFYRTWIIQRTTDNNE